MSLADWQKNGWLRPHQPSVSETRELLAVADRDLRDCLSEGLSEDWQFGIAYNAALQLARVALHAAGYETQKGDSHHFRAIDSLQFTAGLDSDLLDRFQTFRKKRSTGVYESVGMISPADAKEMLLLARNLWQRVQQFLERSHPELIEDDRE